MKETGKINNKKHYRILLIINKDIYKRLGQLQSR
ncbi:hypothetical protein [Proteus vulgaris]|nr:hypothetical protein [Proteus vulgaris]MBI6511986.1 hypothetical protein [Proteus sp. PR00174]NBN44416.1 hypothetical protein [Proteus sp. G2626]NBN59862.1 hypothetical protein [Proteus sp. G2639]NBN74399.1 hypothetical protein [Proteus sp. G2615]NBN83976.1 hypothetical protein [Proteus sp. G2300]